jgi:low affinity Fe/Cu permease
MDIQQQSSQKPAKFQGLAWTALITGIVGVVGSPMIFVNNLTALGAFVGVILGIIALFGTRKLLAAGGVVLCILAVVLTVQAQQAATEKLDRKLDEITREFK